VPTVSDNAPLALPWRDEEEEDETGSEGSLSGVHADEVAEEGLENQDMRDDAVGRAGTTGWRGGMLLCPWEAENQKSTSLSHALTMRLTVRGPLQRVANLFVVGARVCSSSTR